MLQEVTGGYRRLQEVKEKRKRKEQINKRTNCAIKKIYIYNSDEESGQRRSIEKSEQTNTLGLELQREHV